LQSLFRGGDPQSRVQQVAGPDRKPPKKRLRQHSIIALAMLVGIVAGFGAVLFRDLIALFHNLFFLGAFSFSYDANTYTPASPWGPFIILAPAIGALGVTLLVTLFAPEAKGHGVPEVMDSVYYGKGIIRPIVALIKSLASALCIGSGGSVGREGPIVQIGSAFGSMIGQFLPMTQKQRIILLAAGAAGGIAATFNTPIGGILFAVELIVNEVSISTLVPVAISSVTATYVGRLFFGIHPSFVIPNLIGPYSKLESPEVLLSYAVLGILMGAVSFLLVRSLYLTEDFIERHSFKNPYLRHASAMLVVGAMFYLLLHLTGHYHVDGVGYATIQTILQNGLTSLPLLLLLFVLKVAAMSLTLGSGGSGGVFSPSLFLGAAAGGAYGVILLQVFPSLGVSPAAFAVAGMAGVVGGATGAVLTSIIMIFEMTLDYSAIVPLAITVAFSYAVRKAILRDSIYSTKLTRRGHVMPDALRASFLSLRTAGQTMTHDIVLVPRYASQARLAKTASAHPNTQWFLVERRDIVVGVISRHEIPGTLNHTPGQAARLMKQYSTATEEEIVFDVAARMRAEGTFVSLVCISRHRALKASETLGVLGRERLGEIVDEYVDFYSE
jgi:chloride channel protein, CIC family